MHDTLRTTQLVTLVGLGAVVAPVAAASGGSVTTSPSTANEPSTHTITVTVGSASTGSLNGLEIDYREADADISNVGVENVLTVGIDRDDDAEGDTIDEDVSSDLESAQGSNNGETLTLSFGGSYDLDEGDQLVVVIEEVQNPGAGEYPVGLDINPQSSGGQTEATLRIGSAASDTATESGNSNVSAPGFGPGLTVVALLGAVAFALGRRD